MSDMQNTPNDLNDLREWVNANDEMIAHEALDPSLKTELKFFSRQAGHYLRPIMIRTLWMLFLFILLGQLYYLYIFVPKQPVVAPIPLSVAVEQIGDDLPEPPKPPSVR
ncbi:MAG: hypothetical protein AAF490_11790 [Chloroflexota bacterium]